MYKLQRKNGSYWITITSAIQSEREAMVCLESSKVSYRETLRIIDSGGSLIYME